MAGELTTRALSRGMGLVAGSGGTTDPALKLADDSSYLSLASGGRLLLANGA